MKNIILLSVFLIAAGVMFFLYFFPNVNRLNNIDYLKYTLKEIAEKVPDSSKVFFFSEGSSNETEMFYKTQFALAPHVVIVNKFDEIPKDAFVLILQDQNGKDSTLNKYAARAVRIDSSKNDFYNSVLLKKIK